MSPKPFQNMNIPALKSHPPRAASFPLYLRRLVLPSHFLRRPVIASCHLCQPPVDPTGGDSNPFLMGASAPPPPMPPPPHPNLAQWQPEFNAPANNHQLPPSTNLPDPSNPFSAGIFYNRILTLRPTFRLRSSSRNSSLCRFLRL